jgi:hypothetical protein
MSWSTWTAWTALSNSREKQLAWLHLSEEQDDQQQWEKNFRNIRNKITSLLCVLERLGHMRGWRGPSPLEVLL